MRRRILGCSSRVIFHWTLRLCKNADQLVRYLFSKKNLPASSCKREVCFQTLLKFLVPFTRPLASSWHLEFWNGLKNRPFSYIFLANLLKNFRINLNYLSFATTVIPNKKKNRCCSQHSIIDFTSSLIIQVPWPFQHMSIE